MACHRSLITGGILGRGISKGQLRIVAPRHERLCPIKNAGRMKDPTQGLRGLLGYCMHAAPVCPGCRSEQRPMCFRCSCTRSHLISEVVTAEDAVYPASTARLGLDTPGLVGVGDTPTLVQPPVAKLFSEAYYDCNNHHSGHHTQTLQ